MLGSFFKRAPLPRMGDQRGSPASFAAAAESRAISASIPAPVFAETVVSPGFAGTASKSALVRMIHSRAASFGA